MSYRKRAEWPTHVPELIGEELRLAHETARAAEIAFKIRIYIAMEQGLTTREIAEAIGMSKAVISKYRIQGEALYQQRRAAGE